jgi:hypothetical protein
MNIWNIQKQELLLKNYVWDTKQVIKIMFGIYTEKIH